MMNVWAAWVRGTTQDSVNKKMLEFREKFIQEIPVNTKIPEVLRVEFYVPSELFELFKPIISKLKNEEISNTISVKLTGPKCRKIINPQFFNEVEILKKEIMESNEEFENEIIAIPEVLRVKFYVPSELFEVFKPIFSKLKNEEISNTISVKLTKMQKNN
jgi:hypothetical protein